MAKITVTRKQWQLGEEERVALYVVYAPAPGQGVIALDAKRLYLGREPTEANGIAFDDERMSRTHAAIHRLPVGLHAISDCESKNGTFVNGAAAAGEPLAYGDVIRIGDTVLVMGRAIDDVAHGHVGENLLLGRSSVMAEVRRLIARFAPSELTMLLLGDSGTGKEVTARLIHKLSPRSGKPFVAINCASIPTQLVERELFGHVRGAYTSADRAASGYIEAADGGTLFLDEIGELPLEVQPKLLRFLEDKSYAPLGSTQSRQADVRIVAATNQDLAGRVRRNQFREDLFARIDEATLRLPPLRDRREDLNLLIEGFLARENQREFQLTADFVEALALHDWPRNVRELEKIVRRLIVLKERDRRFEWTDLPDALQTPLRERYTRRLDDRYRDWPAKSKLRDLLALHRGNVSKVADDLGVDRKQVYRWLTGYALNAKDFRG